MAFVSEAASALRASNTGIANPRNWTVAVSSRTKHARGLVSTTNALWLMEMNVAGQEFPNCFAVEMEPAARVAKILYATRRRLGMTAGLQAGFCIAVEWVRRNVVQAAVTWNVKRTKIAGSRCITVDRQTYSILADVNLLMCLT